MHENNKAHPDTLHVNSTFPEVYQIVKSLYLDGYNIFMTGMSKGFDLFVSEVILRLREDYSEIMLIAIIPYMGQELGYSEDKKSDIKLYLTWLMMLCLHLILIVKPLWI